MSDTTLNVSMFAAGIVLSTAIAVFLYFRAKKEPRPVYVVTGHTVVEAEAEKHIEVRYKGKGVPIVTRTVITFWNAGRQPIRRSDLVESHPLTILLPDGASLLDFRVIAVTRQDIGFKVHLGPPGDLRRLKPTIYFNFLNHRDGGAVEVLHTGEEPLDLTLEGPIVGVSGPPSRILSVEFQSRRNFLLVSLGGAGALIYGVYVLFEFGLPGASVFFMFGGLVAIAAVEMWLKLRRSVPRPLWRTVWPSSLDL